MITPELVNLTRSLYNTGLRVAGETKNENLKNAALVLAKHLFNNTKVATGEEEVKLPEKKSAPNTYILYLSNINFIKILLSIFS